MFVGCLTFYILSKFRPIRKLLRKRTTIKKAAKPRGQGTVIILFVSVMSHIDIQKADDEPKRTPLKKENVVSIVCVLL
jgi:hypothetical protein